MENAILKLWPSPTHEYSHWTRRRVKAWCENSWLTVWGASSTGKAQPLDAIVYTHVGPARMGDLKVGDRVITQEGKTSEVLQVWPRGMLDCYRITFSDGSSTECAGDHLWEVGTDVLNWSRNRVVETEWLVKNYNKGIRKSRYYIPMCEPVYFRERSIGVDPPCLNCVDWGWLFHESWHSEGFLVRLNNCWIMSGSVLLMITNSCRCRKQLEEGLLDS